jgi:hypothetical protein
MILGILEIFYFRHFSLAYALLCSSAAAVNGVLSLEKIAACINDKIG